MWIVRVNIILCCLGFYEMSRVGGKVINMQNRLKGKRLTCHHSTGTKRYKWRKSMFFFNWKSNTLYLVMFYQLATVNYKYYSLYYIWKKIFCFSGTVGCVEQAAGNQQANHQEAGGLWCGHAVPPYPHQDLYDPTEKRYC